MNDKKQSKVNQARQALINHDIYFIEFANGHFQVGLINFWATSGTWIDNQTNERGKGLHEFINHIERRFSTC